MIQYTQFTPPAPIAQFVECLWTLEMDDPSPLHPVQRVVPDGCTELIINLDEPFQKQDACGNWNPQPQCFFAGQITGPLLLRPGGHADIIGIRFRPHGAGHGLGLPSDELTGTFTPVEQIFPRLRDQLRPVYDTKHVSARIPTLANILIQQVDRTSREDKQVSAAVEIATCRRGLVRVGELARFAGMSSRQLERRFKAQVGITPKLFCRMLRFQRVLRHAESRDPQWPSVAVACGYYDQAHLIRDFKQFSGETPTALLCPATDLAEHFLKHKYMSRSSKTATVRPL